MAIKQMELAVKFNGLNRPAAGDVTVPLSLHAIHELQERVRFGDTNLLRGISFVPVPGGAIQAPRSDGKLHAIKGQKSVLQKLADQLEQDYKQNSGYDGKIGLTFQKLHQVMLEAVQDIRSQVK